MDTVEVWAKLLYEFLVSRKWEHRVCSDCGNVFFAKGRNETKVCQRGKCSHDPLKFLSLSKRRIPLSVSMVAENLKTAFRTSGYAFVDAVSVTAAIGATDLIGAGVQSLEPVLFGKELPTSDSQFLLQPSIRMKHFGSSKHTEGNSTAFVNICSLHVKDSFERHLKHLDFWLQALSELGLFMGNVTLMCRTSDEDWGNGPFRQFEVFVIYGGLELGDASYGFLPTQKNGVISVSDIGFGLERITWAVSKLPSYFDLLRPITFGFLLDKHCHDALRTAALLMHCGVEMSNVGVGFQLRKLCRAIVEERVGTFEACELLRYYCDFWSRFLEHRKSSLWVVETCQKEIARLTQAGITNALKVPRSEQETTEAYAARLVYNLGVPVGSIRKVLS